MRLDDYARQVHDQMTAAAQLGDERTQQIARALVGTADSAVRLAVLAALGDAAAEITAALLDSPGSPAVAVRLEGEDVRVDVRADAAADGPPPAPSARPDEGDASARISLRLPESLKADVEQAAAGAGVSVNTWLVRAAESALAPPWAHWAGGAGYAAAARQAGRRGGGSSQRVSGWING
jgi:uncharacterized protein (DUF1778 family)